MISSVVVYLLFSHTRTLSHVLICVTFTYIYLSAQDKVRDFIEKFDKMKGAMKIQASLKSTWYADYIADGTAVKWQFAVMSVSKTLQIRLFEAHARILL